MPVVVLEDAEQAVPTAKALLKGGINAMEITFRTSAAKASIAKVAAEVPEMIVGAGTVVNVEQLHDAESFAEIGPWIGGAKRYFLQVFTDRETVPFAGLSAPSPEELRAYADLVRPFAGEVQIRGGE